MKATLFLISLGLASASLSLALPSNVTLTDLSRGRLQVKVALEATTRQFEVALNGGGPANSKPVLTYILEHTKLLAQNITILQVDYTSVLGAVDSYFAGNGSLGRKLNCQAELAQLNSYGRQLATIQRELLALIYLPNSRHHPQYVPSERLVMAAYLLSEKMISQGAKIAQVDGLLDSAKQGGNFPQELPSHLPAATKGKVIKLLQEFSAGIEAVMAEIETEYYGEVERLRLQGQKLSLEVQTTFEGAFDVMHAELTTARTLVMELEKHGHALFF